MGETARRHSDLLDRGGKGMGLDRLLFFSDAVFAIAITILTVDLGVRTVAADGVELSTAVIGREIVADWPSYLAYAISFAVIGSNWAAHHRNFSLLVQYDSGVVWVNLALLLFVAFLPFPTRTMFEGDGQLSIPQVVFYAVTVMMIGLLQLALWSLAWRRRYLDPDRVDDKLFRYVRGQMLVNPAVFAASIVLELTVGAPWSLYFWAVQIPIGIVVARYEPRERISRNPG